MKRLFSEYLFLFLIAGTIIFFDQLTKAWVRQNLDLGEIYWPSLWLSDYIRLLHWKNYGAAFGIFQNGNLVFTILAFIVSLVIIYYFPQVPRNEGIVRIAMSMMLGGAVGNLIDRLHQGYVTDFVSVGEFPVFNIADASISTGVAVLFIGMWLQDRRKPQTDEKGDAKEKADAAENQNDSDAVYKTGVEDSS